MFQCQPFRMWRSHAAATKNNDAETTHAFVKLKQIKAAVSAGDMKISKSRRTHCLGFQIKKDTFVMSPLGRLYSALCLALTLTVVFILGNLSARRQGKDDYNIIITPKLPQLFPWIVGTIVHSRVSPQAEFWGWNILFCGWNFHFWDEVFHFGS